MIVQIECRLLHSQPESIHWRATDEFLLDNFPYGGLYLNASANKLFVAASNSFKRLQILWACISSYYVIDSSRCLISFISFSYVNFVFVWLVPGNSLSIPDLSFLVLLFQLLFESLLDFPGQSIALIDIQAIPAVMRINFIVAIFI